MPRPGPDPNILLAANLLLANATNVANARNHLRHERHLIDGYPTGNDNPHVTSTNEHTPTELAVIQRAGIDNRLADLNALVRDALNTANEIHRTTARILAIRVEVPRCSATGRDGAVEWADPLCTAVPSRGPLCDRCARREHRYRQARGLPSRIDGLFSGGDAA